MAKDRFDMSLEAIRERHESWRQICENDEDRVASDFWRDTEALLLKLGALETQLTDAAAGRAYAEGVAEASMEKWQAAEERCKALEGRLSSCREALRAVHMNFDGSGRYEHMRDRVMALAFDDPGEGAAVVEKLNPSTDGSKS